MTCFPSLHVSHIDKCPRVEHSPPSLRLTVVSQVKSTEARLRPCHSLRCQVATNSWLDAAISKPWRCEIWTWSLLPHHFCNLCLAFSTNTILLELKGFSIEGKATQPSFLWSHSNCFVQIATNSVHIVAPLSRWPCIYSNISSVNIYWEPTICQAQHSASATSKLLN